MKPEAAGALLVLRLRRSRIKARDVAVAEVVALLRDLGARPAPGGPLSQVRGVAWVSVPESHCDTAVRRLRGLGYSGAVELLRQLPPAGRRAGRGAARRRRAGERLERVYEEPDDAMRAGAPDRRAFLLECGDGVVRRIAGYRGGPGPLEHRALPVEDARVLVNMVASPAGGTLLDPFAGAGGVVIEARARGWTVVSVDRDPALRFGLAELGSVHLVGDASALPFATASIDAVATEPPHHPSAQAVVVAAIGELARVLRPAGRAALLLASHQAVAVRQAAGEAGFTPELDSPIDRKGTAASCLCLVRP